MRELLNGLLQEPFALKPGCSQQTYRQTHSKCSLGASQGKGARHLCQYPFVSEDVPASRRHFESALYVALSWSLFAKGKTLVRIG